MNASTIDSDSACHHRRSAGITLPPLFRWYEVSAMLLTLGALLLTLASGSLWA